MSAITPQKTPGIFRLVSTQLASGVAIGAANNDNITFNTNIPFTSLAMRIWRTRLINSFSTYPQVGPSASAAIGIQLFGQLTENQTKTSVAVTDSSYLDQFFYEKECFNQQSTAASIAVAEGSHPEIIHDFAPNLTPWTVATKLNWVVSSVNPSATAWGSGTWKPLIVIEYTLETLTADLSAYLSRRLQIQGS